jgi:hypothetical protein
LVLRLLKKKFQGLTKKTESRIHKLSTDKLQELREALLDFKSKKVLEIWLNKISGNN